MSGFAHEGDKIIPCDSRRHGVHKRMDIDPIMFHEPAVQNGAHPPGFVIDDRKGCDLTRLDTKVLPQLIRGTEAHPARPANDFMDRFEIDPRVFQR